MPTRTSHFRVDNGDMSLIELESGRCILVDIKIREAADDLDDDAPDVGQQLRKRLRRDGQGRLYVDAFLLTHPDEDHCAGLMRHFHLGPLIDWSTDDDKIVVREMWSSPIIFRRASKKHVLCDDAKAWAAEARRRVGKFREAGPLADGDRIRIMGEDADGKTDDLAAILVRVDQTFGTICGVHDGTFEALLLGPLPPSDEVEEEVLSKNDSSVIIRLTLRADGEPAAARYLLGGDAEVAIWERLWAKHKGTTSRLEYDVLVAPHHCSWHSLSWDSWSGKGEDAKVSEPARNALAQARAGAVVLASSCAVRDDDNDPPCIRAKREYASIVKPKGGTFRCLGDGDDMEPFVFDVTWAGPKVKRAALVVGSASGTGIGQEALAHG